MPIIRIQHSFQGLSGIAKDQYVNTFHVSVASYDSTSLTSMAADLKTFYHNTAPGAGHPLTWYMAGQSDTAGARIKAYDLSDAIPRTPIYDEVYAPAAAAGGTELPLPSEVACCLSYAAAPVSGVPMSRLRGRIYIGPLSTTASELILTNGIARPAADFRTAMVNSAERLASDWADATPLTAWVVYSPTASNSHIITNWWSDDAWDTQRRRGDAPTSRVTAP